MVSTPEDRRRAERVRVNFEFGAQFQTSTFVANLSEHGVFVRTEQVLPMGTDVELRFTVVLDDPVVLEGRGRVVRHQQEPPGMGFEFTALDPAMILRVNDVVHRSRPRDSGPPLVSRPSAVSGTLEEKEPGDSEQTLVNLKAVDVEILDEHGGRRGDGQEPRGEGRS